MIEADPRIPVTILPADGLAAWLAAGGPAAPVTDACREAGLLVLTAGDKVVRLAPPLIVEPADCQRALDILGAALAAGAK